MEIVRTVLGELHFDSTIFFTQLALFYIMHLLLKPILYTPLEKSRDERDALTGGRIDEAERINNQALEIKQSCEETLRKARQEALERVQEAGRTADAERVKKLEAARAEAEGLINAAQQQVKDEKLAAEKELTGNLPILAHNVAERLFVGLATGDARTKAIKRLKEVN